MSDIITGKSLKYGDNINTDIISPPQYMEYSIADAAPYAMSAIDTDFAEKTKESKIFVAGKNLGSGSSRETAPLTLKYLGIKVVIAEFFARIFYRNCINLGLPAIECAEAGKIDTGDELIIDLENGVIKNVTKKEQYECSKLPAHIFALIEKGGLISYLKSEKE